MKISRFPIKIFRPFSIVFIFLLFSFFVKDVQAATLSFKTANSTIRVGDTVAVEVFMDTEGKTINVIDGAIGVTRGLDDITIKELSTANSALSYWPRNPSWSEKEGAISFVGGTPGGFKQKAAPIFRIYFLAKNSGSVSFSSIQVKAYSNDGLATPVQVSFMPLDITINNQEGLIVQDEWKQTLSKDFQAPAGIKIDLGQDPSLFDGQKFINIFASDPGSGIDHFEVKEGERSPVRTSGTYVLQNQEKLEPITIFAYDKAGNISKKDLIAQKTIAKRPTIGAYILGLVLLLLVGLVIYKIIKKKRK